MLVHRSSFPGDYPEVARVFVDERDKYLSYKLYQQTALPPPQPPPLPPHLAPMGYALFNQPRALVGVVGIGHSKGIEKYWGKVSVTEMQELTRIPKPSRASVFMWSAVKYSAYGLVLYGAYRGLRGPVQRLVTKLGS